MQKKIINCLNENLVNIYKQTIKREGIEKMVNSHLPDHLKDKVSVASFNNGCLVIKPNNTSHATELRYLLPELRSKLRKEKGLYGLTNIKQIV